MISLENLQVMFSLFVICVIRVKKIYCVFYGLFSERKYQNECKICLTNQHIICMLTFPYLLRKRK